MTGKTIVCPQSLLKKIVPFFSLISQIIQDDIATVSIVSAVLFEFIDLFIY